VMRRELDGPRPSKDFVAVSRQKTLLYGWNAATGLPRKIFRGFHRSGSFDEPSPLLDPETVDSSAWVRESLSYCNLFRWSGDYEQVWRSALWSRL